MKLKKLLICLVCVLTIFTTLVFNPSNSSATESVTNAKLSVEIPNVIKQYMDAINNRDWDRFVKTYSPERQKYYVNFPSENQIKNRTGILSVDSIQIYEAKKLPATHIMQIEPYFGEIDSSLYENIQYYYIGFDYKVNKESEFFYNGVRYELLAVGSVNGTEYIVGHENVYDINKLDEFGYTFNSEAERKAQNVVDQRERGLIVNFNNEIISSRVNESIENVKKGKKAEENKELKDEDPALDLDIDENKNKSKSTDNRSQELIDLEKASQGKDARVIKPFSATSPPSSIKLYITSTGDLVNIGFDEYAKEVLPNEWYPSWEEEALKAGAIAIKTYAWYNATYPRRPATDYGAHLTDNPDNYQHYVPDSNEPETDDAVDEVSGIFMRNSDGEVFDAQYRAGTEGEIGEAWGGVLYQWGTQYIATNYPEYGYYTILSYYYSYSDKSSGLIETGEF